MKLYKYNCYNREGEIILESETIDVEEKSKTYVYSSNHAKRIPKECINKIEPETRTLYLLELNNKIAAEKFIENNQCYIDAYNHTIEIIKSNIEKLNIKYLGEDQW